MNNTKFTVGVWSLGSNRGCRVWAAETGTFIADAGTSKSMTHTEKKANADLIVNAPKLYSSSVLAVETLEALEAATNEAGEPILPPGELLKVRRAIKKIRITAAVARGEA